MLKGLFSRARRASIIVIVLAIAGSTLGVAYASAGGKGGTCKRNCSTTDTTAPSVSIGSPTAGSTVQGSVTVSGTATDNVAVASVAVSIDGGSYSGASGAAPWGFQLNSSGYADGSHTISARATDTSGNSKVVSESVTISNAPPPAPSPTPTVSSSPSPTASPTPSPTPTSTPVSTPTHMVTPEGVTIDINSAGSWTTDQIYSILKANALDLSTIGPHLMINVQDTYSSQTVTSAVTSGGTYTAFQATVYLKGVNSTFSTEPDAQLAHEYGHVWTLYHLYMTHNGDWSSYLNTRWANSDGSVLLGQDSRLDSAYSWMRAEIIADDYRLLFGSSLAISERNAHLNPYIPDPRNQPGLKNWMLSTWG